MCIACGRTAGKVRFGRLHAQGHGEFARVARSQTQSEVRVTLISIRGEAGGGVSGDGCGARVCEGTGTYGRVVRLCRPGLYQVVCVTLR